MKTRLTKLLGIEVPIICGGMMRVGTADLAAAVSNAGGLGVMTALTCKTADAFRAEIARCQSLTAKPFAVNLTVGVVATPIDYGEYIRAIIASGVKIVETAGRSPEPFMEAFKAAGIKVIHKCVTVRHARSAEKIGVDVVSIDGFECAGHPGEQDIGGLVLFPAAADALSSAMPPPLCWAATGSTWAPASWRPRRPRFIRASRTRSSRWTRPRPS